MISLEIEEYGVYKYVRKTYRVYAIQHDDCISVEIDRHINRDGRTSSRTFYVRKDALDDILEFVKHCATAISNMNSCYVREFVRLLREKTTDKVGTPLGLETVYRRRISVSISDEDCCYVRGTTSYPPGMSVDIQLRRENPATSCSYYIDNAKEDYVSLIIEAIREKRPLKEFVIDIIRREGIRSIAHADPSGLERFCNSDEKEKVIRWVYSTSPRRRAKGYDVVLSSGAPLVITSRRSTCEYSAVTMFDPFFFL